MLDSEKLLVLCSPPGICENKTSKIRVITVLNSGMKISGRGSMVSKFGCVDQWFSCRLVSDYWLRDAGQMREAASYQQGHHCTKLPMSPQAVGFKHLPMQVQNLPTWREFVYRVSRTLVLFHHDLLSK